MCQISFQMTSSVCAVTDFSSDDLTNKMTIWGPNLYTGWAKFKLLEDVNGLESNGNLIPGHF